MSDEFVIKVNGLTKVYRLYDRPADRVMESLLPFGRKRHRDFFALRGISFEVKRGDVVGVIGKNGSGKSTLLKIITGVLTPTEGSVAINGRVSALLELGAAFNPELTGLENVYFTGTIMGYSRAEMNERLEAILAFADIGEFVRQPVKTYSSGMFVRLAFAVAINIEPEILVVDEALAVGDAQFQRKCLNVFYDLMSRGCTIFFVSHDPYLVRNFCKKALYLDEGTCKFFGSSHDAIECYQYDSLQSVGNQLHQSSEYEINYNDGSIVIKDVQLIDSNGAHVTLAKTGDELLIKFTYLTKGEIKTKISFVINLFRHDDLYIFGTTSIMDGLAPFSPLPEGEVLVRMPNLRLLSGRYKWRIAINDDVGIGVYAQTNHVCEFKIVDGLEAMGLIDINREWLINK